MSELVFEDRFEGSTLDSRWLPHYLPHWSSRKASAARYSVGNGLKLRIDADQDPWCPEFDGDTRVSSLQTGVFSGPLGSAVGQSRYKPELRVREEQENAQLFTPLYGRFEMRAKALTDPGCMVALWMIGYEDEPEHSAEICIAEIFGRNVRDAVAGVGMGVHPFGDPAIRDEFSVVDVTVDVRDFHVYAAEWRPGRVRFYVDDELVKTVEQAPDYPMQFMLGVYEFAGEGGSDYPKVFEVDYFRAYR